jgi:hypothetical protein
MRLVAQLYATVPSNVVSRDPSLFEKMKRGLGGRVDLTTDQVENQLEATTIIDAVKRTLVRLGVGNALSLVIDDTVIFQDTDGKADDLPDLIAALADHASVFGRGFRELRFAAEHEEAGLHLVIEARARTRHHRDEPAAVVSVGGRIRALEPRSGETAEAYRTRVEPLTKDPAAFEATRHAFDSFVARFKVAFAAVMPEATIAEREPEVRLVKAPDRGVVAPESASGPQALSPTHPAYDPFLVYYPSPMGLMLDAMLFTSFMNMMMPPPVLIMTPMGAPLGHVSDIQADPDLASDARVEAEDHGHDQDQDGAYHEAGYDGVDTDAGGDVSDQGDDGGDDGGGWGGDDDGGSWI